MSDQLITPEGYEKLKKELELLSTVRRREIADRIERAKEMGDLSENAEYNEAKDAQAFNEGRIAELFTMIKNLTVVENGSLGGLAGLGSIVTAEANGKTVAYTIVSFNEADPGTGKISNESPLGRSFVGRKKGDEVEVDTPRGTVKYKILKVE
jgi:transcription elongation factor GreA